MTAIDIIKSLPLDDEVKTKILSMYNSFTPAQKVSVEHIAWKTYFALYDERLNENLGMQYEKVKAGDGNLGTELYRKALKKTDEEMTGDFQESISEHDLTAARKAMEVIVKEIQASKKASHAKN